MKKTLDQVKAITERTLENTVHIRIVSDKTSRQMDKSTSALLTAIAEVGDIVAPTTFVILPHKLGEGGGSPSLMESFMEMDEVAQMTATASAVKEYRKNPKGLEKKWLAQAKDTMRSPNEILAFVDSMKGKMEGFEASVAKAEGAVNEANEFLSDPFAWGRKKVEAKAKKVFAEFKGESFWLYLVDEYTGVPIDGGGGLYPIEITKQSGQLEKAMPYMKVGITAMKATNGLASVGRM
jgi:hypothetical protein